MANFVMASHHESCLCVMRGCYRRSFGYCKNCPANRPSKCVRYSSSWQRYYYHPYKGSSCVCSYQCCRRPYWSWSGEFFFIALQLKHSFKNNLKVVNNLMFLFLFFKKNLFAGIFFFFLMFCFLKLELNFQA